MLNIRGGCGAWERAPESEHTEAGVRIFLSTRKGRFLQTCKPTFVMAAWQWVGWRVGVWSWALREEARGEKGPICSYSGR